VQDVVDPVGEDQIGLEGAEEGEQLLLPLGVDDERAVAPVEAVDRGPEEGRRRLYFAAANGFDFGQGGRWLARPQGRRLAFFSVAQVVDLYLAAGLGEAGDGAAGARAEIGGVGTEDQHAPPFPDYIAHILVLVTSLAPQSKALAPMVFGIFISSQLAPFGILWQECTGRSRALLIGA